MQHTHRDMYVYIHIYIYTYIAIYIRVHIVLYIYIYIYLVGGLEHFSIIYGMSSFPLTSIFFKMVIAPTRLVYNKSQSANHEHYNIS